MSERKQIAIIGSGIAGLTAAWHLHKQFDLTLFEKADRLGGHTDTHQFELDGETVTVDSGFIVYSPHYYPHFSKMLDDLDVETAITDMSFSAYNASRNLIYNATSINKLFCQRKNLLNPRFYRMLWDILRFYRIAPKKVTEEHANVTTKTWLEQHGFSSAFMQDHLFPMIGALWSANWRDVADYPIHHLVSYMSSHGMMKIIRRPKWHYLKGGSHQYIQALKHQIQCDWQLDSEITQLSRANNKITLKNKQQSFEFDAVVVATHSDEALALLDDPSEEESAILSAIEFEPNEVIIHCDNRVMHPNRLSWASWNTTIPDASAYSQTHTKTADKIKCSAVYWMNSLQNLDCEKNVFVSLNPQTEIHPKHILARRHYHHPRFTARSVAAQKALPSINGQNNTYFSGAWTGWGFHEDGARSAYQVSQKIIATYA